MCDIGFEKTKDRGGTVKRTSETAVEGYYEKFRIIQKRNLSQNTTGRLLLIIAVSILVTGELANDIVN